MRLTREARCSSKDPNSHSCRSRTREGDTASVVLGWRQSLTEVTVPLRSEVNCGGQQEVAIHNTPHPLSVVHTSIHTFQRSEEDRHARLHARTHARTHLHEEAVRGEVELLPLHDALETVLLRDQLQSRQESCEGAVADVLLERHQHVRQALVQVATLSVTGGEGGQCSGERRLVLLQIAPSIKHLSLPLGRPELISAISAPPGRGS